MFLIFSKVCHNYICFVTEKIIVNFKIYKQSYHITKFKLARVLIRMQCEALKHATSNVVGVGGLLRVEESYFIIQASSPLTKKQNFKFLKIFFSNFKIPFTRKN